MQSSIDERLTRLNAGSPTERTEPNAFSDAVLGVWWGSVGGFGATFLAWVVGGIVAVCKHGIPTLSHIVGWSIGALMGSLLMGVGIGAMCGFIAAAVARFGKGRAARILGGGLGAMLPVVAIVAVIAANDVSMLLDAIVGWFLGNAVVIAVGAGLVAGAAAGREIGT